MELLLISQYPDIQTAAQAKKLPALQQAQILVAVKAYFGPTRTLIGAFRGGECELTGFRVVEAAHPEGTLYDYWETNADSGYVFVHGTTTGAGVEHIQFSFEAMPRTPEAEALAAAMQRAKRLVGNPVAPLGRLVFVDNGAGKELLADFRHPDDVPATAAAWQALLADHNVSESFVRTYAAQLPPAAWLRLSASAHSRFSEQFYYDFADHLDWHVLSGQYQALSPDLIRDFADRLDWATASAMQTLPEDVIRAFSEQVDWGKIAGSQPLSAAFVEEFADRLDLRALHLRYRSEAFIRQHQEQLDWRTISQQAILSESFIREFQDRLDWHEIAQYQCLSTAFVEEFRARIHWYFYSMNRHLTDDQIRHFKDDLSWSNLIYFGRRISEEMIRAHEAYIGEVVWRALIQRNRLSPAYEKEIKARLRAAKP
jgi:hypothetical protein